jgi:hypothetical protein
MKLDEHTRRLLLLPSVRIVRSKLCSLFSLFSGVTKRTIVCAYIDAPTPGPSPTPKQQRLVLAALEPT